MNSVPTSFVASAGHAASWLAAPTVPSRTTWERPNRFFGAASYQRITDSWGPPPALPATAVAAYRRFVSAS